MNQQKSGVVRKLGRESINLGWRMFDVVDRSGKVQVSHLVLLQVFLLL